MSNYTSSIHYDQRLYQQDIAGSIAHTRMLARQGIITDKESEVIVTGLVSIREEIERGDFPWREELEDIHMNIEARLQERIGPTAGKLHTGRSRNDQVALDVRMYAKEAIKTTLKGLRELQKALINRAETNETVIMPGYTHLQRAQPVLFAHHMLAYFEMLERDMERFRHCYRSADVLTLGSGALAGVPYPIDREFLAEELGFGQITGNSMDAVSDRDFLVDYHSAAATCMMHLSRLSEEIVLWSSQEFDFVRLPEEFVTGSSIMPQKRNPDFAELARGKTGRVYGHLLGILTVLKGLPLTYNRDLQEDKEGFFDTVDTLLATLEVMAAMVASIKVNVDRVEKAASGGYMLATDLADHLVSKGVPFREAHSIVGQLCSYALSQRRELSQLTMEEYHQYSPLFGEEVCQLTPATSVAARNVPGGTAPSQVKEALKRARTILEAGNDLTN